MNGGINVETRMTRGWHLLNAFGLPHGQFEQGKLLQIFVTDKLFLAFGEKSTASAIGGNGGSSSVCICGSGIVITARFIHGRNKAHQGIDRHDIVAPLEAAQGVGSLQNLLHIRRVQGNDASKELLRVLNVPFILDDFGYMAYFGQVVVFGGRIQVWLTTQDAGAVSIWRPDHIPRWCRRRAKLFEYLEHAFQVSFHDGNQINKLP